MKKDLKCEINNSDIVMIREEYKKKGNDADTYMYKAGRLYIILPLGEIKAESNPGISITQTLIKLSSLKSKK